MKQLVILLIVASALYAQCPLGFAPEEACDVANPSCALFTDNNGDNLCDNAGLQEQPAGEEPEPEVIEEEEVVVIDPFCPLSLTPREACSQENARCTFYTDSNGDNLCDNPGPQPAPLLEETEQPVVPAEPEGTEEEIIEPLIEEEIFPAPEITQVTDQTETILAQRQNSCPLGYTENEACDAESPDCAFFVDLDGNGLCDNPEPVQEEDTLYVAQNASQNSQPPVVIGCPLGLPPAAACPDSLALCPHWYGVTSHTTCSNPAGGSRRTGIILITLGILLPVSTGLSRKFYGRRLKDRLRRNTAHHVIRGVSLMILGFGVQGCFCPLGTFQYAFTAGGLAFLGVSGILIFLLPMIFSAFFGRVFCGWVCPIGALQEFLYSIHVPGRRSLSGNLHSKLKHLSTVILFALITAILLNRFDVISLRWSAPFCAIDPFHTIFTLFLSGSLTVAGLTIILAVFIRRFFCKYLCFYGAALALLAKLALWNRIKGIRTTQPERDSDEEFDK